MIPAAFDYQRASSVDEAVGLLGEHGDDAKLLAGGHSLLPLMRLRLAAPAVLIDIGRLDDLSYVRSDGGQVRIGALTRHHDLAMSDELRDQVPLLAHIAGQIGDPQVRHRGTIGGSIAHGDPASDLPAALLALRGSLVARGPGGEREIPADEMFTGFLETALAPDEVLTEIRVPAVAGAPWGFQKFVRRAQDWAIVGCAAVLGNGTTGGPGRGHPAWRRHYAAERRRATRPPGRTRVPIPPTTSTPPQSSAVTSPRCWSAGPSSPPRRNSGVLEAIRSAQSLSRQWGPAPGP
jgi:carbon-monoxide dehydrogenase medium subunit